MAEDFPRIRARLDALRAAGRPLSNYFFSGQTAVADVRASENAVAWWHGENGFHRLYFAASDGDSLAALLGSLPSLEFVADCLAREGSGEREALRRAFDGAGFAPRATFARLTCSEARAPGAGGGGARTGTASDAHYIHGGIFSDFDRHIDHIPTAEAFAQAASEQRLVVVGPENAISAYATFSVEGRRFHFDRLCNRRGDPLVLLTVLGGLYREIARRGLAAGFLWANRANRALLALHERCGFRADAMLDDIYLRQAA
jgi:hypothetical protein